MKNLRRIIPNLSTLYAFEAAGRLGGFTRAAQELGLSQAAVSQSIRMLEESLGEPLFARVGRSVRLTPSGERLHRDVTLALEEIRQGVRVIMDRRAPRHVTVSGSSAFAAWWMAPRLGAFHALYPDIDLRLQTADRDEDIRTERIALGVRHGNGDFPGFEAHLLAQEEVYPVCVPALLKGRAIPFRIEELYGEKLIHLEEPYRPAVDWGGWFRSQGFVAPPPDGLRINDYALVLQAVLQGQGVALGWAYLCDPLVRQGVLVRPVAESYRTGWGFYVIHDANRALSEDAARVLDWMTSPQSAI